MNCKPGILAFVVVPADWPSKTLDGMVVEVLWLRPPFPEPWKDQRPTWWCKFPTPWMHSKGPVSECFLLDAWLRPISGVPVHDEQCDEAPA
ncbi:hypothetical protein P3W85_29870 [Cupriavidus basilensis]|uniref:Uncharacterized protein n=1 Tax=Cupriavidus basilensis TaxID=68895 RepID=A0ABT6AZJ6_9BURK|nr:hypothetical protein [Cupriavidus basilensis]MDF3837131.1 hypothetical protein [Cupriavidus basilensis]